MAFVLDTENTTGDFQPVPAGIHLGICIYVVDIGTQQGTHGPSEKLMFVFETPEVLAANGKPMTLSRRFGKTLSEKGHLRPFLYSWLGQPLPGKLDLEHLAGKAAMLVVSHSQSGGKTYSNINTAAPLAVGSPTPSPSVLTLVYGPDRNPQVFAQLPEWIRKTITLGGAAPINAPGNVATAPPQQAPVYQASSVVSPPQPTPQIQSTPPVNLEAPIDDALTF